MKILTRKRSILLFEISVAITIIIAPLLVYLHVFVPETKVWETYFFVHQMQLFSTLQMFVYNFSIKVSYFILLYVWFLTCEHWWRYGIFSLVIFIVYRLFLIFFSEINITSSFLNYIIVLLPVTVFLYWLAQKINYKFNSLLNSIEVNSEDILKYKLYNKNKYRSEVIKVQNLKKYSKNTTPKNYLHQIILKSKQLMYHKSGIERVKIRQNKNTLLWGNIKISDAIIFLIIISLPFLYYLYELTPKNSKDWDLGYFKITAHLYPNVTIFIWLLSMKIILFIALTIWFLTCRHWWKFTILGPFSIVSFQILELFNNDSKWLDEYEIWYALPILLPLLLFMVWLSNKLNYYALTHDLSDRLEFEIGEITRELSKENLNNTNLENELVEIVKHQKKYTSQEYLKKLIVLKEKLKS